MQYEIYNPLTKEKLDLSICDENIEIVIPVNLDNSTKALYEDLNNSGYDLFDSNDDFYNDICTPYTSENGTDLTIQLRQNQLYTSLCQEYCEYDYYNVTNNKVHCNCISQKNETKVDNIAQIKFVSNLFIYSFYNIMKISNFLVVKCFKLAFSLDASNINIGRILMTLLLLTFLILDIFCFFTKDKKILELIKNFINIKFEDHFKDIKVNKNSIKIIKNGLDKSKTIITKSSKKSIKILNIIKPKKRKGELNKNKEPPIKKNIKKIKYNHQNNNNVSAKNNNKDESSSNENLINSKKKNRNISSVLMNDKIIPPKILKSSKKLPLAIEKSKNKAVQQKIKTNKKLNYYELSTLKYTQAIKLDKRSYCKYYLELLSQKQLILFSFISRNDYNLRSMKFLLFILSISLYFTINAFFFTDDTMNKIYVNNGYNIFSHVPNIIYSSLLTTLVNIIIKNLALSEKNIISIKKEKNYSNAILKSKRVQKDINIKFLVFFVLGFILMTIYWYFITCFCAVYRNTQIILIKNTLFSFLLSMSYPFGLELLPGMFRINALRAKRQNKECMFTIGNILTLF